MDQAFVTECSDTYAGALFCSGFEESSTFATITKNGAVEELQGVGFSGTGVIHTSVTETHSFAHITGAFSPMDSGTLYFRAYYFIPPGTLVGLIKLISIEGYDITADDDDLNVDINVVAGGGVQVFFQSNTYEI